MLGNAIWPERGHVVGASVVGLLTEAAVTAIGVWAPSSNGGYGAPFEMGHRERITLLGDPLRPMTFSWGIFTLDVAVAMTLFLVLARWSGLLGLLLGTVGALVSLALAIVMALSGLPTAGLPIPIFRPDVVSPSLVLWLDMFLWAAACAGIVAWRRQRRPEWGLS